MRRGGIETFIMNLYRVMDRSKIQFDFLVSTEENPFAEEISILGGKIYVIPPRNNGFVAYRKNIDVFFRAHKGEYIAVHQHVSSLSSIYPLQAAKRVGIKKRIIHSHSSSIKSNKLHYILHLFNKLNISRLATHYFACSDVARHWLFNYTGCLSKSEIINNGIINQDFIFNPQIRDIVKINLQIKNDQIAICHIGSFIKVKNHTFLLDIFKELIKLSDKYQLFLIGDGELKLPIQTKINNLSLSNSVRLLGLRGDVNILMQGFDCLVFPSLFEGLPVTLVEAQASDLQVVCSNTISQMSKISDDTEFVSLSKSAKEWASIIDNKIRLHKRKNNSNIIENAGFDISKIALKLYNIYLE